jgi:type I restriction enzyme S subunit
MGLSNLTTYKLGDLIEQRREKYDGKGNLPIRGVSADGFIPPKQKDADTSLYNVFYKNDFVFNPARMELNSIALNTVFEKAICSSLYEIFYVKDESVLIPKYLNLFVKRKQFARQCEFIGWGSAREYCRCADISTISITLPDVPTQQKYVDIYDAMCANQKAYEKGLDDLKLTCDAYIEELRRKMPCEKIGPYIQECDSKNSIGLTIDSVRGIATSKELIPTKANMDGVSLENYKVVAPLQITYVPDTSRRGDKISLGINKSDKPILVSSISIVFETEKKSLLSEYLMLFFVRSEFDRYARFNSWGSARETFDWNALSDYKIPIPDITTQKNIAEIYKAFNIRKNLNEKLKQQIKNICPILIKGAIEEGKSKRG